MVTFRRTRNYRLRVTTKRKDLRPRKAMSQYLASIKGRIFMCQHPIFTILTNRRDGTISCSLTTIILAKHVKGSFSCLYFTRVSRRALQARDDVLILEEKAPRNLIIVVRRNPNYNVKLPINNRSTPIPLTNVRNASDFLAFPSILIRNCNASDSFPNGNGQPNVGQEKGQKRKAINHMTGLMSQAFRLGERFTHLNTTSRKDGNSIKFLMTSRFASDRNGQYVRTSTREKDLRVIFRASRATNAGTNNSNGFFPNSTSLRVSFRQIGTLTRLSIFTRFSSVRYFHAKGVGGRFNENCLIINDPMKVTISINRGNNTMVYLVPAPRVKDVRHNSSNRVVTRHDFRMASRLFRNGLIKLVLFARQVSQ